MGQTWGDLFWDLKEQLNCVPIGIGRASDEGSRELTKLPPNDRTLHTGDHIILITEATKESDLESFFGTDEGIGR